MRPPPPRTPPPPPTSSPRPKPTPRTRDSFRTPAPGEGLECRPRSPGGRGSVLSPHRPPSGRPSAAARASTSGPPRRCYRTVTLHKFGTESVERQKSKPRPRASAAAGGLARPMGQNSGKFQPGRKFCKFLAVPVSGGLLQRFGDSAKFGPLIFATSFFVPGASGGYTTLHQALPNSTMSESYACPRPSPQ